MGKQDSMSERRNARRYDLSLPVVVRDGVAHHGQTRDISTRGVYLLMDERLEAGSTFDFTLTLPQEITGGSAVVVKAQGRVIRVDKKEEEGPNRLGVAAIIEKYEIVRAESTH